MTKSTQDLFGFVFPGKLLTLIQPHSHLWPTNQQKGQRQTTFTDVQPHICSHPQSDRQIGKHITGRLTTNTHTDKTDTPHHSLSWPCLLMTIAAMQQPTSSFHRFLCPKYLMCFVKVVLFYSSKAGNILLNKSTK